MNVMKIFQNYRIDHLSSNVCGHKSATKCAADMTATYAVHIEVE